MIVCHSCRKEIRSKDSLGKRCLACGEAGCTHCVVDQFHLSHTKCRFAREHTGLTHEQMLAAWASKLAASYFDASQGMDTAQGVAQVDKDYAYLMAQTLAACGRALGGKK